MGDPTPSGSISDLSTASNHSTVRLSRLCRPEAKHFAASVHDTPAFVTTALMGMLHVVRILPFEVLRLHRRVPTEGARGRALHGRRTSS